MTKKELPLKTSSSSRVLPIPDYVFEAILEERKKYERYKSRRRITFHDDGYICCSNYSGKPRSKDFHWRHYKELLKKAGLPDIRWHDLRSTYCTLLLNKDFNPKALCRILWSIWISICRKGKIGRRRTRLRFAKVSQKRTSGHNANKCLHWCRQMKGNMI